MKPLMLNDIDPLPTRLGATVGARKLELVPVGTVPAATYRIEPEYAQHLLTADNRAWVQAYEATERDLAVRPKRFYSRCSREDPLGQVVRKVSGTTSDTERYALTDDEARAQMIRAVAEDDGDRAFLGGIPIEEVYKLYVEDLQLRERECRERDLLERIRMKGEARIKAQLAAAAVDREAAARAMLRGGSDAFESIKRRQESIDRQAFLERCSQGSVAEQLMDRVRAEFSTPPVSKQVVLVIDGTNVPMGPGAPPSVVIKDDLQESVWRVLGVRNDYATLERNDGTQRIVHIAQLAHDTPF